MKQYYSFFRKIYKAIIMLVKAFFSRKKKD
nr:MAG TPA: hypothetical protein [Bacteriophage sp.]